MESFVRALPPGARLSVLLANDLWAAIFLITSRGLFRSSASHGRSNFVSLETAVFTGVLTSLAEGVTKNLEIFSAGEREWRAVRSRLDGQGDEEGVAQGDFGNEVDRFDLCVRPWVIKCSLVEPQRGGGKPGAGIGAAPHDDTPIGLRF